MSYTLLEVSIDGPVARVTLNNVRRRNALSFEMLSELQEALREVSASDATGMVLGAHGSVFSSGHDFADLAARDAVGVAHLLELCTDVMLTMHSMPQVVIGRIQGLATGGGCQLAASTDLAVAGRSAGFQLPGGKGGWFCHTPSVPVARAVGRKRLMEMALTGDIIDAETALSWGLVNRVVDDDALDEAVDELLARATRGSAASKAWGKRTLYAQLDRPERDAYSIACESMTAAAQTPGAREGITAFVEKRHPVWSD
ncbi:MAG: enoyl-CoA hydratase-related protein [Nakamurella sp.]